MNLLRIPLIFVFLQLASCADTANFNHLDGPKSAQERRLLVTFADRSINRQISGSSADSYRISSQYANSSWSEAVASKLADQHHLRLIAQWAVTELGVSCVVYEAAENVSIQQVILELQQDQAVFSVQPMQSFQVLGSSPTKVTSDNDPYLQLQTGYQSLGIGQLHKMATGRGVRIALIDTGVDVEHPDLKGQIKYSENMAPTPADQNLADIHGTAVAGIISARVNNGIGIAGIAPAAEILAFRACWPDQPKSLAAHCNSFTLALALNQAIRMDSRIINLSLSGPEDPLIRQLIEKALEKNIIIIAAVPGKDRSGGFPASLPGVIAVGNNSQSSHPEVIAPGQDILTTVPQQAYDFMNGSSFATPHVSGIAALLLELHPMWQAAEIKQALGKDLKYLAANLSSVTDTPSKARKQ